MKIRETNSSMSFVTISHQYFGFQDKLIRKKAWENSFVDSVRETLWVVYTFILLVVFVLIFVCYPISNLRLVDCPVNGIIYIFFLSLIGWLKRNITYTASLLIGLMNNA